MASRRKHGRRLPLGHKPRGRQRVATVAQAGRRSQVKHGPTAQQSVVGTQTALTPGVFSSAAGGAGYRTLEAPNARPKVQPFTLGFFAPFAQSGSPFTRSSPEVPFSPMQQARSTPASSPAKSSTPQRSSVFPAPK